MKRYIPGLVVLCIFFAACDQEPLFWDIAHEYPPIKPIIGGAPSIIVAVTYPLQSNPVLYVSNGEVWEYDTNTDDPVWRKMSPQPGGKIKTLAATEGYLFSLDWDGKIRRWNGTVWDGPLSLSGISGKPEQIFGAKEGLFAGALTGTPGTSNGYCILAMSETGNSMTVIKAETGLLFGAVYGESNYFIGTRGDGIYMTNAPGSQLITPDLNGTSELSIAGLIIHNGKIVAVTTKRQIIYYDSNVFVPFLSPGVNFSGAMASWEDNNGKRLLLLGLLNSSGSFGYGYRELDWDTRQLNVPGVVGNSSVKQGSEYTSAIGNCAVTALYVLPPSVTYKADEDKRPVVFASTVTNGLWSYRTRGGIAQWNGENNSR